MSTRPANEVPERPVFFATLAAWRSWLQRHHATEAVLWVGFHKKGSGKPSITWPESVDGALCFGWIDGLRRGLDETSYAIRFTPRKPRSVWSDVNTKRYEELLGQGLVHAAGRAAYARRTAARAGLYSFEQPAIEFPPETARDFRAHRRAWTWFQAQPPSYRRAATWWVISAKQAATRERRFATLLADCAAGRTIAPLTRKSRPS